MTQSKSLYCFNPWYVGGGVKSIRQGSGSQESDIVSILGMLEGVLKVIVIPPSRPIKQGFNPWYVGGGVKSSLPAIPEISCVYVSILGMLEGVLKVTTSTVAARCHNVSILGMLEGVLKARESKSVL